MPLLTGLALAVAGWAAVLIVPAYSEDRQRIFTIEHVRNTATGEASWGIYDDGGELPDTYRAMGEWRRDSVLYARRQRWLMPAPAVEGSAPALLRFGERGAEGGRVVTFEIAMNGWDGVVLNAPAQAQLKAMRANGRTHQFGPGASAGAPYVIRCTGRSCDGLRFHLLVGSNEPVEALLIGYRSGLPEAAAPLVRGRPEHARPQYVPDASYTLTPIRL